MSTYLSTTRVRGETARRHQAHSNDCIGFLEKAVPVHESDPNEWWTTWEVTNKGTYLTTHFLLKRIFSANAIAPSPVTIICTTYVHSAIQITCP